LAGDATLAAFAPELLSGSYSRQHEKTVPIVYTGQIKPASQHQLCGEVTLSPRYAKIYGTEQVLSGINHVETSLTDYEGVQDTFATRLALIAPQGVRVKPDSIELQAVAELFTEKAIQLTINTPDLTDKGQTLHLFPSHVTVTFRVGATWFNRVGEGDIEASVDMPQPDIDHLPVHIASHNPHITHIRIKPEEVEYLIENYETHSDGGPAATVSED
jgi:YbbR domain-containing protein